MGATLLKYAAVGQLLPCKLVARTLSCFEADKGSLLNIAKFMLSV